MNNFYSNTVNEPGLKRRVFYIVTAVCLSAQFFYVLRYYFQLGQTRLIFALTLSFACSSLALPIFYFTKNLKLSSHIMVGFGSISIALQLYLTGGVMAPGLAWLLVIPPIYFTVLDKAGGYTGLVIAILILAGFVIFKSQVPIPDYYLNEQFLYQSHLINNLILIIFFGFLFFLHNSLINKYRVFSFKKLDEIDMLLKIILHDVSNPISVLKYNHEKMSRTIGDSVTKTKEYKRISSSVKSMELIIEQVRNMRLLAHEGLQPTLMDVKIDEEIDFCIDLFMDEMLKKNISYKARLTLGNRKVVCDSNIFKFEVLSNILSNAIKFSPRESTIEINSFVDKQNAVVQVIDNGPGIPGDVIEAIELGESPLSSQGSHGEIGQGFGLAITKKFIEVMGGELSLNATGVKKPGTVVELRLPLS